MRSSFKSQMQVKDCHCFCLFFFGNRKSPSLPTSFSLRLSLSFFPSYSLPFSVFLTPFQLPISTYSSIITCRSIYNCLDFTFSPSPILIYLHINIMFTSLYSSNLTLSLFLSTYLSLLLCFLLMILLVF